MIVTGPALTSLVLAGMFCDMNASISPKVRYLLAQVRNGDDPMRDQEIDCFAWALHCEREQISVHDLLNGPPSDAVLARHDVVMVGGSGDYSTVPEAPWLDRTLDFLRDMHVRQKPVFGSCWGFQALGKAFGGTVITDVERAELGTPDVTLTAAGQTDPVFGSMPKTFPVLLGHEDRVVDLPGNAVLLASTTQVTNQAFRFEDAPIYATQFHPELHRETFLDRIRTYPKYVNKILGIPYAEFERICRDVPATREILTGFVQHVLEGKPSA
ncbi:MAG: type 1 glutamine amidotransferase [Planctomycetota bacterium]